MSSIEDSFVHLARLALARKHSDVHALVRQTARRFEATHPDIAKKLEALLLATEDGSATRAVVVDPLPVDTDSRLELIRREYPVVLDIEPSWNQAVQGQLGAIVQERRREKDLLAAGLFPTRSLLMTGPPGVGKTLSARWLAKELNRPLLTLDLAAVMSSFLGRTGNNVRTVLDFARRTPCVLLLDEFDAVAKRRDDATEIGELKRLVTVLLQAIDDWPAEGLLVAATNHADLLDPATWRRFEQTIELPLPDYEARSEAIKAHLGPAPDGGWEWVRALAIATEGMSFADLEKRVKSARREAVLSGSSHSPTEQLVNDLLLGRPKKERQEAARLLACAGLSERHVNELTGVSRDTIRKFKREAPVTTPEEEEFDA